MNEIKYFDIHSHLNFPKFEDDREEVIEKMKKEKVVTVTVGTDLNTSLEAIVLADNNENFFASVGLHPHDANLKFDYKKYLDLAKNPKVVSIGECGLDYFRLGDDFEQEKKRQVEIFEKQIEMALELDKPLMIHCRDAYEETLEILERYKKDNGEKLRGIFHFFSSTVEIAQKITNLGFYVSFAGPITFAKEYEEVVRSVPQEYLLADTDSPFAAPLPYRGKRNEPLYIKEIIAKIAKIRGEEEKDTKDYILRNAKEVFRL